MTFTIDRRKFGQWMRSPQTVRLSERMAGLLKNLAWQLELRCWRHGRAVPEIRLSCLIVMAGRCFGMQRSIPAILMRKQL